MDRHWVMRTILLSLMLYMVGCQTKTAIVPTIAPTMTPTRLATTSTPMPVQPDATPTQVTYTIRAGDTLSTIAAHYDIPLETLQEANGISDPNLIQAGQKLIIPMPTVEPTATVPPTVTPTPVIPPQLSILDVLGRGVPSAETVILVNTGRPVSLEGWSLRDGQGNAYILPNIYLGTDAELRIHTGQGENTPQHLYWNKDTAVWEETDDTAILADERGVIYASRLLD